MSVARAQETASTAGWAGLSAELARWQAAGRRARLWWRDDDAVDATPALDRLIALALNHDVPLALAVIPAAATPALAARISREKRVVVLQHGWAHANHAPAGAKKSEFPAGRAPAEAAADLERGRQRLVALFGDQALPVLTPPWNRLGVALDIPVSGFGGLGRGDTHVDIIDWRGSRGFVGEGRALGDLVDALALRRAGSDAPVGLLTHHLVHDQASWAFLDRLLRQLARHPAIGWPQPRELFRP